MSEQKSTEKDKPALRTPSGGGPEQDALVQLPDGSRTLESVMGEALKERGVEVPERPASSAEAPAEPDLPMEPGMSADLVNAMAEGLKPPDRPEGYVIERPFLPRGAEYDEEFELTARKWFHGAGLNQGQVSMIVERYNRAALDPNPPDAGTDEIGLRQTEAALRREWGDAYEQKIAAAQAAVRRVGGRDLVDILDETQLGNDPEIIKMFADLAEEGAVR